ncbi:MucBP domain-containing protein [Weissella cibaria]|uniref:MucBP domain-containing protein n=1 Tax=Weissella cibaria TaxID=137591 RepID=UPI003983142B
MQRFKVVYAPQTANITYYYYDENGKTIATAVTKTGYVGAKIPANPLTISGYTLIGPSSDSDDDGLFDADRNSVIKYQYRAQYQSANVVVDSASPVAANSAVASASGVTSGALSFSTTDSQLAKSGYTYVVYGPTGSTSYATLSAAVQANSLYDATENGSASSDASAQTFRVSYKADMQSAYIRVQQNSPISSGVMVDSIVGSTSGKLAFSATDATLAVSGYTYTVGYGYDAANTVWYSNLAAALAANGTYDATNNNGGATDTNAQRFVVLYAPMSQAAAVVIDASSPISAGSTAMSANGMTGSAISFAPSASNTTLDSQLAKSGYTYTVRYGSDSATFTTLSSALAAHSFYNANNTTSGVADDTPDKFTVSYKADYQSAVVNVTGTSPIRANSKFASNTGGTSDSISFSITDANLYARGYMYTVTGPDGQVYSNLASALSANPIYDNTNNLGTLNDSAVQSFMVSYRANYQSAYLQMDENAPRSAGAIVGSAAGVTAGNISFNVTDSQLAVPGYQYNIYTAMGSSYATLSSALVAEGRFDSTQNVGSSDQSAQAYFVVYTADQQSAYIQVNAKSPISAGNMVDSQIGQTSGALTFVDTDDSDLYVRGYHYTVTGPDGKAYSNLSSAIAANSIYDATDNTGANDASAQAFTVNYVADRQQASLAVTSDSPISMGSVVTTASGGTAETIPFAYNDSQIAVSGYSYRVMGPDGEWYSTLAAAQSNNTTFDDTSNATDSDAEAQMFTISYSALSQAARVVGADKSPIRAGLTMGSAAGVTSQAISFASTTDATLAQSGYSCVVYMGSNSTTSYSTLSAAMAANSLYNNTNTASGASDADPQIFTVSYVANYQSANLVVGGNTQISSGVTVDSAAGVTSDRASFGTNDSALRVAGYRYTVKTPDGKTYTTLSSALAGTTGLYDNTNNATNSDAAPQTYTVEYAAITQTAEVVVAETKDEYSGQVLETVTGDTGAALGIKLTDATLQSMEMTQGYTYYVTVKHADDSFVTDDAGNVVRYATLDEAIAANNSFDAVDDNAEHSGIKQFVINPVPSYQESTLTVTSDSPISAAAAVETTSGVTNSAISYSTTDSTLAVPGYTYQVSVVRPDGTTQSYATLSSALAAQSLYDNTSNGDTQSDKSAQAFQVSYKADYQSANITFMTDSGAAPMSAIAVAGATGDVYGSGSGSSFSAASGYYFTADGQPSGASVAADGKTIYFTFTFDNTDNPGATDSAAQNFTLRMAPASQSGNISFSYADAIGSPTVPADVPLAGVTGDSKTGTITAPEGYYIVSISGDPYNVVYTDETHQEVTYSVILDDTPNGNSATDGDSQDMVVTFAPNNQTANIIQAMPDGTTSVVDTQNAKTNQSYAYEYTTPAGYYVASGSAAAASGMTTEISNDGKTVNVTGTYDNSKNTDASGTDEQTQDTTITLSKSEQVAMFKINVPTWPTTVTAKMTPVQGYTAENITLPQGFSDSELTKDGYSYTVTGPDGEIYDTMAKALAANPIFDSTNNGSAQDTEAQNFTVTYVAADQSATIKQQYADGAPNTPAFPQSDETLNGKSEQVVKGTFNAPTGYKITSVTDAPGIVWTIAADEKSATYTLTYDTVADTDGPTQNTVVTYTPLAQKVVVEFVDEVGRTLTTDTKVQSHTLTGVTNETVNYDDASLQADQKIAGYQLVVQNQSDAANFDNNTAVDQKVRYVYRDVQAPTITTTKDELVSSKSGMPATEADFLAAVGFKTTDNQQYGTSVTTTDYETIAAQVAEDGVSRDVTITVKDATGNTTTKTVTLTAVETAPVSQETAVKDAQQQLDDLAKDPTASDADVAQAKQALQDAVDQAKQERDAAKTTANDALTSDDTTAVATDPAVADAMQDLRDAIAAGDADTGTSQAITDATNALENAVARAEAKAVDTAPVAQEADVQAKQDALNDVLDDPTSTTEAIDQAKQALQDAVDTAKQERDAANQAADTITDQVAASQDDAVKDAVAKLADAVKNAANNEGTTQDITDAQQAVVDAVKDAANTALNQDNTPVQNETSVIDAKQQLTDILNNPDSTPEQIVDATNAYDKAVADAKADRDAANQAAQDEITSASQSNQANDQSVIDAAKKLQDLIDAAKTGDPNALTDDIAQATQALKDAVADAGGAQDAARADAAKALNETTPVTYEPGVQDKIDALNNVLNDPTATADQINDATQALRTATETAVDQRATVDQDAATAITNAQGSNQSDEPSVQAAEQALQDLVDQAKTDNPDALTQDIRDAIKNLQDAIAEAADNQGDARQAAQDALNATAPVSHEQATADAIQNLQDVLNNPAATTADIQEATEKLTAATATDQVDRDAANTQANDAVSAAETSDQATEPGVLEAIQHLKDVQAKAAADSSDALTDDIKQAINDLAAAQEAAKQNQQAARDAAAQAIVDSQPVSNEATVTKARDALNQLLQDPSSSTADIEKATDALIAANTAEQTKRDTINQQADAYETKVANSNQREEPAVQAALDALQELQDEAATDSPDALTADIANALDALRTAVTQAAKDQAEARDNAADALADLAPVSNEPAVQAAKDALDALLADSTSTADDIKQATQDLLNATSDAKAERTTANTDAQNAMTDAQNSKQADEPAVQDALKHLQDVMDAAANDDANALTADIIDAQKALEQAVADAKDAQEQARKDAAIAIASTSPVSNEPGTAQALNNLEAVLKDPNATQAEITAATKALRDQTATDKQARDTANTNGDAAIKLAQASNQSDEPSVVAAIKNLQDIMTAAATDTNTALTKDITSAIAALQTAEETAQANQEQARTDAQTALDQTAPVSNEAAVADAISNLQKLLDDPKSTAKEIADATTALTTAVADANEKRDAANTAADQAVADVPSELTSEPTVAAAEQALKQLQDAAAADQSDALTADIEAATKALQDAVQTADQARDTARDAATDLLTQTAPLSNEAKVASAKDALQKLLDDSTSTTAAIENATAALRDALQADGADRNAANTAGTSLVDLVKGAPAYTDKAVQDAVQKLQDVMAAAAKDSATDLTADIEAATKALQDTFTAANSDIEAARDAANALLGKTAPISHEPAVATAIADLEKILQDASSSAETIEAATKALQDAMTPAQTARDTANTDGQKLLDATKNTTAAKDKGVQDAMSRLQAVMAAAAKDSATNLTADIEAAMKALQAAVNTADGGRQAAVDAANDLLTKTAPVSHEADVAKAIKQLQAVVNDPTASETDIETATAALQTALDAANKARTTADTAGTQAIKTAQASDQSADPAVQAAIKHLQDVMAAAATDSAHDLTADIEAAMKALQAAVQQSASERATAATAANDLLGKTAPVSHEPAVADAISKLQAVLDDPKATAKDIQAATAALQTALDAANAARANANKAGHDAVTTAQNTAVAGDPAVQAALAHLQAIMDAAGKDSANDLTADILAAVKALEAAIAAAEGKPVPTETSTVPTPVATPVTSSGETSPVAPQSGGVLPYVAPNNTIVPTNVPVQRSGVLPYTGYTDDWRLTALGIFLFSASLLFVAAKRRKREEEDK